MTPHEYLQRKGLKKVHQPWKRYDLSIEELVDLLNEYSKWKNLSILDTFRNLTKEGMQLPVNFINDKTASQI
jgi:hypothetical protein